MFVTFKFDKGSIEELILKKKIKRIIIEKKKKTKKPVKLYWGTELQENGENSSWAWTNTVVPVPRIGAVSLTSSYRKSYAYATDLLYVISPSINLVATDGQNRHTADCR